jgi:hypothetical protein
MSFVSTACSRTVRLIALRFLLAMGLTASAATCKTNNLEWHLDGTVSRGSQKLATRLQSVTAGLAADGGVYLGGYQIDAQNINHPYIVFVPSEPSNERYWPRENSVQDLFLWKGHVNALESSGKAFERRDDAWNPSALQFKPRSVVVATEPLIACNPGPLLMTSPERGSCYSPTAGWTADINWRRVRPAICAGSLTAIETREGTILARQIRPTDGIEVAVSKLATLPKDACSVRFDTAKQ